MKKISICIPAYKRPDHVKRLLESVRIQSFKDYDIIISDDSPDDSVQQVAAQFADLPIEYLKNEPALGTPANWNFAISRAGGEWIKLMHDDDWFAHPKSLEAFAAQTTKGRPFIVSRYSNVFTSGKTERPDFPDGWKKMIIDQPMLLLATNVIGPPSVTLLKRDIGEIYDTRLKWRVDLEFYIRVLQKTNDFILINEPLVNVGISETQVTNDCINEPNVELPEGWLLLQKYGVGPLNHIRIYDAWWRILRNTGIRNKEQLQSFTPYRDWPVVIYKMIEQEAKIPKSLLSLGPVSKLAMGLSYLKNKKYLKGS